MNKYIFQAMRTITVNKITDVLTDENLLKAMTINDELKNFGYVLKPIGIISIAKSDMSNFISDFKNIIGDVNAKPMYPNFPKQVMEISEAEFRFHQLVHYFSTYGIESLFGVSVNKGWLPNVESTEKIKEDTSLLKLKVLDIVFEENCANYCVSKLAEKKERFTLDEKEIFKYVAENATFEILENMNIAFKENLIPVFEIIFESNREDKKEILVSICQHSGDVWKCIKPLLDKKEHFKTSEKRLLVKILESFPIEDFESNLILSNSKSTQVKRMLQYLDYNIYSRSIEHKKAVAKLRNHDLKSWEGQAKALISQKDIQALSFISKRPGMMIRMLTILLRAGYSIKEIEKELCLNANKLSTQTLVTLLTHFGRLDAKNFKNEMHDKEEATKIFEIVKNVLTYNLKSKNTELKNKSVYLDLNDFDLNLSQIECNNKSPESGYLMSGLAIKIPDNINRLRFFVYWNDSARVDIDLHTYGLKTNNQEIHIGWNADFCNNGIVTSGDITHSDAAEYIDIDLSAELKRVKTVIDIYEIEKDCKQIMKNIETVFVGMMAVDKMGEEIKLYNPKNCFFSHFLKGTENKLNYGYIDLENRVLIFKGTTEHCDLTESLVNKFNLKYYLEELLSSQNCSIAETKNEADIILTMEKSLDEKSISLIDNNFYLD